MSDTSKDSSGRVLERLLREPLVHFLGLAIALFMTAEVIGSGDTTIEITQDEIEYRIMQVEAEEGTPLTEQERRLVVEAYIDERVLVREAQEIGLDADERIEDILVQKMLHVLSGDVIQPSEEELAFYYEGNMERYVVESSVTVDELILPIGTPLPESIQGGGLPSELSDEELVGHRVVPELTLNDLSLVFGEGVAQVVFEAEVDTWTEGFDSSRGNHWFRVQERHEGGLQTFSVIRDRVRLDWITEQEDRRLLLRVAELRERYMVIIEEVGS